MRPAEEFARACAVAAAGGDSTPGADHARAGAGEALQATPMSAESDGTGPGQTGGFGAVSAGAPP